MRRSGFTILELIAVIGIIAVIGTAVIGGFSGMMKSVSRRNASDSVRRALNLARQEACVDGNDVYFYTVDVNKYAIVRKAGTITSVDTGSRNVRYGNVSIQGATIDGGGKWIVDAYADLSGSTDSFVVDTTMSNTELIAAFKDYAGSMVFDMDEGKYADIAYPPYRDTNIDAWVFGVKNVSGSSSFVPGHVYGWVTHPIQSLPQGYVFKDTYNAQDGSFKPGNDVYVHFNADGTLNTDEGSDSIELERPEDGTKIVIKFKNGVPKESR